ncbi:immunoglobulin superfamily member 3 isoform 1 precursor [Homo sapiens]|uniref:Isoform 2 of Immunoglobulin superfamily member 3 n=1 Tax=Homo sapiens TaxID=9606 RepID=O75054-2|nr:immunoglobulin superfamily member 3 isoform 1 precursor [Homo sapiens]XP_011539617.1 immunoglobulin superfamily member 3 isoform X2 [Homo sapiens]EAW56659.1 immunoglobulin superfamily, member 3, isoform CRA_c [Homo sapiens]KAI2518594.1 immunoglobulin superfamily member 3 [Homo sapiens]KAI2518595.1 immunoglobulin superfamily member 3 [Homo sapiens]|eukprot:NP_001533.2 immunoglobulin superfamily member 3 isoform 1 precursor [Homo sapiens]
MKCFFPVLSCLAVLGVVSAQRQVTVQEGPLYRTEGSHITIWCNVSGYQGPSEQNFQWSIYLPSSPEREVQIVSTMDSSFPYAIYTQRVRGGKIFIERVQGNSTLLHITDLQARDAGEYECHTPSTDKQYFGSYSAKMNLVVIPDSLQTTAMPQTLHRVEQDPLELTCEVASETIQHSHLSVAWLRQKVGEKPVEVISLSRDFMLHSSSEYAQRQSLGEVRLDKLGRTTFRLTIFHLQPSDQGEFYCEAAEWIQDPDGSWYAMTRKRSEGAVVNVQPTDKEFTVRLETEKRLHTVGEPVEFRCILEAQNVPDRYFAVSWAFNSSLIATMGPNAVPVLNSEFAHREARGQLKVAKESDSVFVLKIYHLRQEDSGKYNCRVTEREKTVTGEFIDKESKRPKNIPIIVLPLTDNWVVKVPQHHQLLSQGHLESSISVEVASNASVILEGEDLRFSCSVRTAGRPQGRFSVIWQLVDRQNRRSNIMWLDRDGTVQPGSSYWERSSFGGVQMEQVQPNSFSLGIFNSRKEDEGQYECHVTEWVRAVDGEWQIVGERRASTPISITALEMGFAVTAISRTPGVTYSDSFDLQCIIKPHYPAWVPVSVTWRFQPVGTVEFHDLVTFTRDGGVQWGDRSSSFRTRTAIEKAESSNNVRLSISRASDTEAGKYQCVAELWRKNYNNTWTRLAERTSNLLEIRVLQPVTKLQVSKSKRTLTLVENKPIQLNCSVKSQTSQNSHFAVLWYVHKPSDADGKLILKTTHNSAFEYGTYAEEEGLRARLQFERHVSGGLFSLTVQRAEVSDSGSYYCHVEEWLLSPNYAWYKLAEEVSGRTEVTVKQPDSRLRLSQAQGNLSVLETRQVQLECVVLNRTSITSQLMVEWFVWKPNHPERETVARLSRDATFHYGEQAAKNNLKGRLHLESPSPGVYRLFIQNVAVQDSGTYSCHVEEWLPSPSGMWYKRAEDTAGQTALTVMRPDASLQVDTVVPNATVSEKAAFQLDCSIVSRSSQDSRFAVAWYSLRTKAGGKRSSPGLEEQEEEREEEEEEDDDDDDDPTERTALLSVGPDAVFGPEGSPWEGRLRFQRLSPVLYRLTVLQASPQDTGNYSCHVEEWLPSPQKEWYRLTEEESAPIGIRVLDTSPTLQSIICSNDALFYFVFFYPFPIFGILIITILLVRFKSRNSSKNSDGKNGVPLLWIKEPHLNYSPTCLEPPVLSIHPGAID